MASNMNTSSESQCNKKKRKPAEKWTENDRRVLSSLLKEKGHFQTQLSTSATNLGRMTIWMEIRDAFCNETNRNPNNLDHQKVRDLWKKMKGKVSKEYRKCHDDYVRRERDFTKHCQGTGGGPSNAAPEGYDPDIYGLPDFSHLAPIETHFNTLTDRQRMISSTVTSSSAPAPTYDPTPGPGPAPAPALVPAPVPAIAPVLGHLLDTAPAMERDITGIEFGSNVEDDTMNTQLNNENMDEVARFERFDAIQQDNEIARQIAEREELLAERTSISQSPSPSVTPVMPSHTPSVTPIVLQTPRTRQNSSDSQQRGRGAGRRRRIATSREDVAIASAAYYREMLRIQQENALLYKHQMEEEEKRKIELYKKQMEQHEEEKKMKIELHNKEMEIKDMELKYIKKNGKCQ